MMTSEKRTIYITGRGGDASKGLGAYLKTIDPHRIGLSVNSIFLSLPFELLVQIYFPWILLWCVDDRLINLSVA